MTVARRTQQRIGCSQTYLQRSIGLKRAESEVLHLNELDVYRSSGSAQQVYRVFARSKWPKNNSQIQTRQDQLGDI
jgi:hypothetical protein